MSRPQQATSSQTINQSRPPQLSNEFQSITVKLQVHWSSSYAISMWLMLLAETKHIKYVTNGQG